MGVPQSKTPSDHTPDLPLYSRTTSVTYLPTSSVTDKGITVG